ncbi:MAG TPA: PAS domain-containing protein, partial [Polyangiaceae bacterium]|nr:PAS domain-containing protein [Polyangiaceae bacterium]
MEAEGPDESLRKRLIESSPDCIKLLDLDGRLLTMNAGGMAALEICDLSPFIGRSWIDFWQGEDREAARAAVEAARRGEVRRFIGFFPSTQTEKPLWFHVSVSPLRDQAGQVEKLLASSRDVTEWKRSDQLLRAAIAESEERLRDLFDEA